MTPATPKTAGSMPSRVRDQRDVQEAALDASGAGSDGGMNGE